MYNWNYDSTISSRDQKEKATDLKILHPIFFSEETCSKLRYQL